MAKTTVLIIEDEIDQREAVVEYLERVGYRLIQADNGQDGLALALSEHPDIILLDLVMPIIGGQEVLKKLREDRWGRTAKVVVMSSMDDVRNVGQAYEGGITDYIMKNQVSLEELYKKVREVLLLNTTP